MTAVESHAVEVRALAQRLKTISERSRSSFSDQTRPGFDEHVIDGTRKELRDLAFRLAELDATLEAALRLID